MHDLQVCVIIVNWNHGRYLGECLDALRKQDYPRYRVTIMDNGSNDGSVTFIKRGYPEVNLVCLTENIGFSKAFNKGVRTSDDPLILSINPDVVVRSDFISELVAAVTQDEKIGIAAPKLLKADEPSRLDSTGLFINRKRRPFDRGQGEIDKGQYNQALDIFGACGAGAMYRRAMLEDTAVSEEFFDEAFFAYYEDADLSWRAQLKGWRAIHVPTAIGTHVRGWGDTLSKQRTKNELGPRLALRNRYLMTIKNDSLYNFIGDLPAIAAAEIPRLIYSIFFCPRALLGILDFFQLFPTTWRKRNSIQKNRVVDASVISREFRNC